MSGDLNDILSDWPFDPASVNARIIHGMDGREKVQLRLDLGVLQMELDGRPDGKRPHGFTSLLDYHLSREQTAAFMLDSDDCSALQQEAAQYYYRYIACFALREYGRVVADTEHNLGIIDLAARRSSVQDVAWQFGQFYPYVRMMNARSHAESLIRQNRVHDAVAAVNAALEDIRKFRERHDLTEESTSREVEILQQQLRDYTASQTLSQADRLRAELDRAIASENYEHAAVIRDALKELSQR